MTNTLSTTEISPARWLHRLCVLAVCLVWPLIWVGGLVTTYDAGMAVPDWPGTYGYNLFLYPYKTWLLGPFDLFIEHGHRLLGAVVGFVAIGIVIAAFVTEPRRWVRWLSVGLLVMVIAQGLLGGMRVVLGDRTLAMVHGCFGPAFFAVCVVAAVVTSNFWWRQHDVLAANLPKIGRGILAVGFCLIGLSYLQLVLGAQLRHVQPTMRPGIFAMIIMMHVMTAFILWAVTAGSWLRLRRCGDLTLSRPAAGLVGLVAVQIALGIGTWVVNYGWPSILEWVPGSADFLIRAKGFTDSIIVTAHVATGSLILAVSAMLTARLWRERSRRRDSSNDVSVTLNEPQPNKFQLAASFDSVPNTVDT
ncbi:COX15/CtaA family protein [Rubripirellula reticaptiva]|uniref:Heme A synthase n=1 Tax=Rubripirellula reticaptiva TaxID=2528013 RepID=A0A5C6FA34_9BACT|nr:COX15/CtaA family protein [Rubripirellula reticaptiva]TWU57347.1 Heme A synthase [Rubripirellula reticaptiva]